MPQTNRVAVAEAIRANSTALAVDLVEPLARVLQIARAVFGDGDKLLLMANITLRANLHPAYKTLCPRDLAAGRIARLPSLGVNLQSLADATGIPKETVRRKVAQLASAGFIARDGRDIRYTPEGYLAVAPIREALVGMAARIHQAVESLVGDELERAA